MAKSPTAGVKTSLDKALQWLTLISALVAATWTVLTYLDQRRLMEVELKDWNQARIVGKSKVEVKPSVRQGYTTTTFSVEMKNTSKTQEVEVSWLLIHWYMGTLNPKTSSGKVWRINSPPDKYRDVSDEGPINWGEPVGHALFTFPGWKITDDYSRLIQFTPGQGGGATKTLKPGDSGRFAYDFMVANTPDTWIGFVASVGTDRGNGGEHLFLFEETAQIPE